MKAVSAAYFKRGSFTLKKLKFGKKNRRTCIPRPLNLGLLCVCVGGGGAAGYMWGCGVGWGVGMGMGVGAGVLVYYGIP